jgi:hypothetical protein
MGDIFTDNIVTRTILDNTGLKSGSREAKSLLGSVGLSGVASFLSVTGAIAGTVAAIKDIYASTMKYGDSVRELSLLNGTSAEETSRLIQLTDDYKISQGDLMKATKVLAKQGLSLTTDQLAKMSDEYLKLNTDAEKTEYLMRNFGPRGGTAFVELMRKGGDAIRSESAAVSTNLILTQKQLDQQRDNQRAIDEVNDAWLGVKVTLATGVIPVYTQLAITTANIINLNTQMTKSVWETLTPLEKFVTFLAMNPISFFKMVFKDADAERAKADLDATNAKIADQETRQLAVNRARMTAHDIEVEITADMLNEQAAWEVMYTSAEDGAARASASMDLLGKELQGLGQQGSEVWLGYLAATGKISPAAIAEFIKVEGIIREVKALMDAGFSTTFIINVVTNMVAGTSPVNPQSNPGSTNIGGVSGGGNGWSSPSASGWETNSITGGMRNINTGENVDYWHSKGFANGGDFTVSQPTLFLAGEAGQERVQVTPNGKTNTVELSDSSIRKLRDAILIGIS